MSTARDGTDNTLRVSSVEENPESDFCLVFEDDEDVLDDRALVGTSSTTTTTTATNPTAGEALVDVDAIKRKADVSTR